MPSKPTPLSAQSWAVLCSGVQEQKKTFKALRSNSSVPAPDTAGPQKAPERHSPGSLPLLGDAGVLFNLFLILSPCIFTDVSKPPSAAPKVRCFILSSWCKERPVYWFASWSFQDRGRGLWLCFSVSSLSSRSPFASLAPS